MEEILNQVIHGKVHVHVGKNGITPGIIQQIENQFNTKRIIKVRFLSLRRHELINEATATISKMTHSKILDIRGKTIILQKILH